MEKLKIDIVITYVNNNDLEWQERKKNTLSNIDSINLMTTSNVEGRYKDNNELKFLLRSIEKNFSFYNKIYIVTDTDLPDWLNTEHKKIRIVKHSSFMDKEHLPTFSARGIEAQLHKIRYLSDYFIYLNDDMFFNKKVEMKDLFTDNKINVYFENEKIPNKKISKDFFSDINSNIMAKSFIFHMFNKRSIYKNAHTPKLIYKPDIIELEENYPELFHNVSKEPFRTYNTHSIIASLYSHYLIAKDKGIQVFDNFYYTENTKKEVEKDYNLIYNSDNFYSVCINDTSDDFLSEELDKKQQDFYHKIFPNKSHFEK